jgi:hypothetical protein
VDHLHAHELISVGVRYHEEQSMDLERTGSGLFLFSPKHKRQERIVTLPNGKRVRVSLDDSGTVKQIEEDDQLHAIVHPKTLTIQVVSAVQED